MAVARARRKFAGQKFAKTSIKPKRSRQRVFSRAAEKILGAAVFPLKPETFDVIGGAFKEAGYRSTSKYLAEAKLVHVEEGYEWTAQLERALSLAKKAAERGIGPCKRAAEIRMSVAAGVTPQEEPLSRGGQMHPRRSWLVAVFWLLREIELVGIMVHATHIQSGPDWVSICLPASKNDTRGVGMKRALHCLCNSTLADGGIRGESVCPVCAVKQQVEFVCRTFGVSRECDAALRTPLFPTKRGQAATKCAVVAAWKALFEGAARPEDRASMEGLVSGHSARRSGAKLLCRCKWDLWKIQWHARWQSDAVKLYTEEVFSEVAHSWNIGE